MGKKIQHNVNKKPISLSRRHGQENTTQHKTYLAQPSPWARKYNTMSTKKLSSSAVAMGNKTTHQHVLSKQNYLPQPSPWARKYNTTQKLSSSAVAMGKKKRTSFLDRIVDNAATMPGPCAYKPNYKQAEPNPLGVRFRIRRTIIIIFPKRKRRENSSD
jgi:hypothetical protein